MFPLYFCFVFVYTVLVCKLINLNKIKKGTIKVLNSKLKPAKFKNKFSLFNLKIVANGYKLKNYKIAIGNSSVKFYKKFNDFLVVISVSFNKISVKFFNVKSFSFVYFNCDKFIVNLNNNSYLKPLNFYNKFKQTVLIKSGNMQTKNFGFNINVLNKTRTTMQLKNCIKKTTKTLNQKIVGINLKNNSVIIKNLNQPLKNIFNFKIDNLFSYGNKIFVNKTYVVQIKSDYIFISKIGFNFNFNLKNLFNFKLNSNNIWLNNLVNNYLPSRVYNHIINSFSFENDYSFFVKQQTNNYYYKAEIANFLLKKQYFNCYNYILFSVLGVWCNNDVFLLKKPSFYLGEYIITYHKNKLLVYNEISGFYVEYNGIVYKNFNNIKLQHKLNYNIDKLK